MQSEQTQTYSQRYLPAMHAYQDELLQRLALLVNIDSGTTQVEGVNRIMAYLEEWLTEIGMTVVLHTSEGFGNNLVARVQGNGEARLLLVGHVDTVYSQGAVEKQPFRIHEGLAYGPGVIDMKSGVLQTIYAVRALLEADFREFQELCIVFNNDEEVGSIGSAALIRDIAKHVDAAFVLEASRSLEIITKSRKGTDKYILEIDGVPAHSGAEPHKGRSAVIELAHKMIAIHNLNTLFPGVTFNVTRVSSSEPLNVVPFSARCHISVRSYTEQGLHAAAAALEQIAAGRNVPDTHARLIRSRGRTPYVATPEILQLVALAQEEGKALGLALTAESKGGLSDANLLMECGVPVLDSLGPVGGGMHDIAREHLRVDSLPLRGALLAGLIQHYCLSK